MITGLIISSIVLAIFIVLLFMYFGTLSTELKSLKQDIIRLQKRLLEIKREQNPPIFLKGDSVTAIKPLSINEFFDQPDHQPVHAIVIDIFYDGDDAYPTYKVLDDDYRIFTCSGCSIEPSVDPSAQIQPSVDEKES